jgi:hypothetical protein
MGKPAALVCASCDWWKLCFVVKIIHEAELFLFFPFPHQSSTPLRMPKRKRSTYEDDSERVSRMQKQDVQEKLTQSKKLLHRALKTAKGFERQKLGKRLKLATTNKQSEEIARINREIEALKGLDLGKVVEAHLHKTLLKIKAFAESELLPDEVRRVPPKPDGTEEMVAALHNVTSGMYNMKPVKDIMAQVVNGMYIAMGIPAPAGKAKQVKKPEMKGMKNEIPEFSEKDDALLGASSDEESFDEAEYVRNRPLQQSERLSLSLSPTPSLSPSESLEPQRPPPKVKKTKAREPPAKAGTSTFLPTLMGGYWSGSESSASDLEADAPPVRKNRPGQMARRAIWEKKFGEKANHIKTGQGPVSEMKKGGKDDGWDAKRGAKDTNSSGRGRFGSEGRGRQRNFSQVTGENAIAVEPRKRGMGKKDDVGVLHPSWQAAKKAKEMKKTATFQGKKMTFD